ncbi:MAG: hypothetical protein QOE57_3449, partial [Acidimicrobiaceae bacterium]|nr:hypothetical protein [Acidimicrobiaceae bacterium]
MTSGQTVLRATGLVKRYRRTLAVA